MTPTEAADVEARIRALRWRTIGTGWVAALVVVGSVLTLVLGFGEMSRLLFSRADPSDVAFHLPTALRHSGGLPVLSLLFYGLAGVGAWGMSTGRIRRLHCQAAFALMLAAGVADWLLAAPLHQPLFGLASRVERLVKAGEYQEAEQWLAELQSAETATRLRYVRAQIALRAGDRLRLRELGRPLLLETDAHVYQVSRDPTSAFVLNAAYGDLRLEVLAAIDRGLHGTPVSAAGLAVAAESRGRGARWLHAVLLTAGALLGAAAGAGLVLLWRRMRGNVLRIIDLAG